MRIDNMCSYLPKWLGVIFGQAGQTQVSIHNNRVLHVLSKTFEDPASAYGCYHGKIT